MTRRLGAWNCPYCGQERILGNVFDCPGCSHPRPKGIHFYQIPDGPIVTPEIQAQLGSGGPNWYCEHCNSGNKDTSEKCWDCGAPKGSSPSHKVTYYREGEEPMSADETKAVQGDSWVEEEETPDSQDYAESAENSRLYPPVGRYVTEETGRLQQVGEVIQENSRNLIYGAIGLVLVLVLGILAYNVFFNTHKEQAQVSEYAWSQNVRVEEFSVVHDSSWTTHPGDAYNVQQSWRDTGRDEKVHDGWKTEAYTDTCYQSESYTDTCTRSVYESKTCTGSRDNGDGSYDSYTYECGSSTTESYSCAKTRDVPYSCEKSRQVELYHYEDIYDNYYEYDVNRWVTVQNYPSSGNDHAPWFYSDFVLDNPFTGGDPAIGQQRKFEEAGDYAVTFTCSNAKVGDDGVFTREYSLAEWSMFILDGVYPIEVNYFNAILSYPQP